MIFSKYKKAKNFIILSFSQFIIKISSLLVVYHLARHLSVEFYGKYTFFNVIISYLILAINFGYDIYFASKIDGKEIDTEKAISIQIKSRFIVSLLIFLISLTLSLIIPFKNSALFLVLIFRLFSFSFDISWLYKIKDDFVTLFKADFLSSFARVLGVYFFVKSDSQILVLAFIDILCDLLSKLIIMIRYADKLIGIYKIGIYEILHTIKKSIPIALSYFMITIYYNLDSLMLGIFKGSYTVAIYTAAYNFMLLAILPTGLLFQVYLSTLVKNKGSKIIYYRYVKHTVTLSLVVFTFLFLLADKLILIIYGSKFTESIPVLKILSFNIFSCYLAGAFANPVNTWGYHKEYLYIVSGGALTNFIGNLIFIPIYGISAAAITTILSEVVVFILAFYWSVRFFKKHKEIYNANYERL